MEKDERKKFRMDKFTHNLLLRVVKVIDAVMVTIPFAMCWLLYYAERIDAPFYARGNWLVIALFFGVYIIFGRVYDAFLISINRISEVIYSQTLAFLVTDGIMYIVIWLLSKNLPNLLPGLGAIAGQLVMASVWALLVHRWYFATFPPQTTAIIYDMRKGMTDLIESYGLDKKYDVRMTAYVDDCIADLSMLKGMHTVFLSGIHSHERNIIIKYCIANDIDVYVIPRIGDVLMSSAQHMHMFHLPMLHLRRYNVQPEYLFMKRFLDIVLSAIVLILLSPVMLVVALAIKKTDGGPVFYKQVRLTKDGKPFKILKFRSMRVDAEKDGVARLSTGDKDDRVTPVGRVIRACRLDELPQLINILAGDMTIVGPRAERPEIAAQYEAELPEFALRLQGKAGLTGYAQVYGKYNTTPYDKLQMDLMYLAHPSIIEDFKIMFATVKILFVAESTEGVGEGENNAMQSNEQKDIAVM